MSPPALAAGLRRAALIACAFTLGAAALGRLPLPAWLRAAGMLALPCLLLRVLRREDRRLSGAAARIAARPRARASPAPRKP